MRNVLVIFEHQKHIESSAYKFVEMLDNVVSINKANNTVITSDTCYKLIGAGFPYVNSLGDKLHGMSFDDVMIHGDVVLMKDIELYIRTRMKESKEFIEFE